MGGTFLVSLDYELFWGMLDVCPLEQYQDNVLGGKKAIPQLLNLFEKYKIHATWATVGFLFADNYQELSRFLPSSVPAMQNRNWMATPGLKKSVKRKKRRPVSMPPACWRKLPQPPDRKSAVIPSATITAGKPDKLWKSLKRICVLPGPLQKARGMM